MVARRQAPTDSNSQDQSFESRSRRPTAISSEPPRKRRRVNNEVDSEQHTTPSPAPTPLFAPLSPSTSSIRTTGTSPSPSLSLAPSKPPCQPRSAISQAIRLPALNGVSRRLVPVKRDPQSVTTFTGGGPFRSTHTPLGPSTRSINGAAEVVTSLENSIPSPTTSGVWRITDIPTNCLPPDPDYKKNRREWAEAQTRWIRTRGYTSDLEVVSAKFT